MFVGVLAFLGDLANLNSSLSKREKDMESSYVLDNIKNQVRLLLSGHSTRIIRQAPSLKCRFLELLVFSNQSELWPP